MMSIFKQYPIYLLFIILLLVFQNCRQYKNIPGGFSKKRILTFENINNEKTQISYVFTVPQNYSTSKKYPLLVALHGYGSNMEAFHDLWKNTASNYGYVLLVPQGDVLTEQNFGWAWSENNYTGILRLIDI